MKKRSFLDDLRAMEILSESYADFAVIQAARTELRIWDSLVKPASDSTAMAVSDLSRKEAEEAEP